MTWDTFIEATLKIHITTSPCQHQTMSMQPMKVGSSRKHDAISKSPRPEVTKTYPRGRSLVFSPQIEEGVKPTTLVQHGSSSHHEASLHDEEPIEHEVDLVDLEEHDENQILQQVIKEKDSQIMELKENLERAKFIISFLEQEKSQLKAKQLVMEKEKFKAKKQEMRGKAVVDHDDTKKHEGHVARKRTRKMGLRKAL